AHRRRARRDAVTAGAGLVAEALTGDAADSGDVEGGAPGGERRRRRDHAVRRRVRNLVRRRGSADGLATTRKRAPAGQYGEVVAEHQRHPGGGFNPPDPTAKGGPDYGRFIDAVRTLQDHARAVDAPDEVITEAANLLEKVSGLLTPFDADEWASPSGRRMDLPMRGNILTIPMSAHKGEDGRIHGQARFARFHLGRNGAVHGGALGMLFDSVLGLTAAVLTGNPRQRTAYLKIDYRRIVPVEKELQFDAGIDRVDGRKIFVSGRLTDGDQLLTEADALFVRLKPGQP